MRVLMGDAKPLADLREGHSAAEDESGKLNGANAGRRERKVHSEWRIGPPEHVPVEAKVVGDGNPIAEQPLNVPRYIGERRGAGQHGCVQTMKPRGPRA